MLRQIVLDAMMAQHITGSFTATFLVVAVPSAFVLRRDRRILISPDR